MSDVTLPSTITNWMNDRNWGEHHLQWHAVRQWDRLSPAVQAQLTAMGWTRSPIQEGEPGNGREFLLMHRAMIQLLKTQFPGNSALFLGWDSPPIDPADPVDPIPENSPIPGPFDADMKQAIERLESELGSFANEDELGLFIETRSRPLPGNPFNQDSDASAGIHNYLHGRFTDNSSPVNMGDPSVNLGNTRFWKLHGWIDHVWTKFRALKGLLDSDPAYLNALNAEKVAMQGAHHHHPTASLAARASIMNRRLAVAALASEVRNPFRETTARRVQRLMATTPRIASRDELIEYLQTAIQVEHATLPLYLTAWWSVKESDPSTSEHREILKTVAFQEMAHFGIICNLLRSIGADPHIVPPDAELPKFPGQLPGLDLSKEFPGDISLEGLSRDRIQLFMRIEEPTHGDVDPKSALVAAATVPRFRTIGEFYDVIIAGVESLAATGDISFSTSTTDQIVDILPELNVITKKDDAIAQLNLIKEQGEGTSMTQASGTSPNELAHYYRFKQIREEKKYNWASGQPVLDPALPLPFPTTTQIRQFEAAPLGGHSQSARFDGIYTQMMNELHEAWHGTPDAIFDAAYTTMHKLSIEAKNLMDLGYGPNFHYLGGRTVSQSRSSSVLTGGKRTAARMLNRSSVKASSPVASLTAAAAPVPGYARVQQILDESVNGESFGAHGAFWRSISRDEFVAKKIFGRSLIQSLTATTFDTDESNLIKALEGRSPFGKNMSPAPAGAIFNRMPDGYPPLPQEKIDEIRRWIAAGCPEIAPASLQTTDETSPASLSVQDYVAFWRSFDNVAMFEATDEVQAAIGDFFNVASKWFDFAKNATTEPAWVAAISDPAVHSSIVRLEKLQRDVILQSFGSPVRVEDLLTCWEKFGDDTLPDDPLRPVDVRHTMNGDSMWFFWAAFVDAALRASSSVADIPTDLWTAIGRSVLLGLLNDGLFRNRFVVNGFEATQAGKLAMRAFVKSLSADSLKTELRTRLVQSGVFV